ncbi:Crp/Fnr family transcriptional regulator [Algicella marina]|uniref:Cyclic nucleotide-binding domain-containing protein n=1 Tax=Algicella marina TaxID=2683284 RepID=A0A6P1T4I6_9RHOB|nr:Crp/Fnr family transcriptional regulator [Algicella marina]QHQ36620.1 cyclic nucleotide-binding domain-containing protein [Algicella marina]
MVRYNGNLEVQYPEDTLLGQLEPATRTALEKVWTVTRYGSGQVVLDHEEDSFDVLFLLEGAVRVHNFSAKGREVSFSNISEGDCVGEFAVIDHEPRSASVLATEESRIARVSDTQFREILATHPDISFALLKRLVGKLREMTRRVSEFTAHKADDRIRLELIRMFRAVESRDGSAELRKPPTQADLAAFVFTNREAVAREIGRMRKAKVLERRGRGMFVPSVDALEEYRAERRSD